MENQQNRVREPKRGRSVDRSGDASYKDVAKVAIRSEKDKETPAISMTVVGEKVEFIQHFHF